MSRSNPQPPNPPRAPSGPVQGPPQFMHHYANPQATQVPSVPLHYRQHPAYSPVLVHHPPPDPMEIMSQRFAQSVRDILSAQQAHNETRMNRLETNIQRLSSDISDSRRDTRDSTANYIGKIAEMLVNSHEIQLARLKRMELVLGMGPDMKDEKSLLARFDLLSFAVEEFLERVKDPEANCQLLSRDLYSQLTPFSARRSSSPRYGNKSH
ncbi:hypothetical protein C8R46DRAFT_381786 [Mycena filopes]|nr:hypothetical protein C8R46DRAFT_381786 [Mycena filopes]